MKLLLCLTCSDIRALRSKGVTTCECGKTKGRYVDSINAEWNGQGLILGFDNSSLIHAMKKHNNKTHEYMGERFEAFIIPDYAISLRINEDL